MKSDRLLAMLLLLQTRGRVRADELAERLEVSVRTVYRDVSALSTAGVPIYAERGRHGGIRLLDGYRTDVTGLTRHEARALFVLATREAHADLGLDTALSSALRKVMAALPTPHRPDATLASERIIVDPVGWLRRQPTSSPLLATLQHTVFTDRRLRLRYRHSGQSATHRYTVDPYGLVAKAGVWYLVADHRGRHRLYLVGRMLSATPVQESVHRHPGVTLAEAWGRLRASVENKPAPVLVRAAVRWESLDRFRRLAARQLVDEETPTPGADRVEVRLRFHAPAEARRLLAFGTDVLVLDPPGIARDLAETATAIAARYAPLRYRRTHG